MNLILRKSVQSCSPWELSLSLKMCIMFDKEADLDTCILTASRCSDFTFDIRIEFPSPKNLVEIYHIYILLTLKVKCVLLEFIITNLRQLFCLTKIFKLFFKT